MRSCGRYAHANSRGALYLLHEIAGVRIAGIHAQRARDLGARDVDQQRVAVARIEPQALRCAGADVACGADGREYRVLDFLKIVVSDRHVGNRTAVCVEPGTIAGATREREHH
jgi:hypothetical protein